MLERHLKQIYTPRLLLRPILRNDAGPLYEAMRYSDKELSEWMPWGKSISPEYANKFAYYCEISWQKKEQQNFPFLIQKRCDGKVIGALGFNEYSHPQRGIFEMGYWLSTQEHGQGFASEAALALSHYAFEELNPSVLFICVQKGNEPSIKIPLKLGYQFQLTRQQACRHCLSHELDDFHVYGCSSQSQLAPLDYQIELLNQPVKILDYDVHQNVGLKAPAPVIATADFMLIPPRKEDLFLLQNFINQSAAIQGRYPWAFVGDPTEVLKDFLQNSALSSQYLLEASDFYHIVHCRKSRTIVGLLHYHMRDRFVPFINISPFWKEDIAIEQIWDQVFAFLKNSFGSARLEMLLELNRCLPDPVAQQYGLCHEGTLRDYWRNMLSQEKSDCLVFVKNIT